MIRWLEDHPDCILGDFIKNIRVFSSEIKGSASTSIIISGLAQPTALDRLHADKSNIIIKVTFDPGNPLNNSLEVGRAIYKNIITSLVNNMHIALQKA